MRLAFQQSKHDTIAIIVISTVKVVKSNWCNTEIILAFLFCEPFTNNLQTRFEFTYYVNVHSVYNLLNSMQLSFKFTMPLRFCQIHSSNFVKSSKSNQYIYCLHSMEVNFLSVSHYCMRFQKNNPILTFISKESQGLNPLTSIVIYPFKSRHI